MLANKLPIPHPSANQTYIELVSNAATLNTMLVVGSRHNYNRSIEEADEGGHWALTQL